MIQAIELLNKSSMDRENLDISNLGKSLIDSWLYPKYDKFNREDVRYFFSEKDFSKIMNKWAFFMDIAIKQDPEDAFGLIVGVRDTHSWAGNKYFLYRPHLSSLLEISNSSPIIFDISFECDVLNDFEKMVISKYLNTYCIYEMNGEKKQGYVKTFSLDSIQIVDKDGNIDVIEENDLDKIIECHDEVGDLSFSMAVIKN